MCAAKCAVTGKDTNGRRYVMVLPLKEGGEKKMTYDLEVLKGEDFKKVSKAQERVSIDGKPYDVPHDVSDERIDGRQFVNLAPTIEESSEALDLEPAGAYQLRHNPPGAVKHVSAQEMAEYNMASRKGILVTGRRVQINRFYTATDDDGNTTPMFEVDYGVLQTYVCRGKDAAAQIEIWRNLLLEQLLEG